MIIKRISFCGKSFKSAIAFTIVGAICFTSIWIINRKSKVSLSTGAADDGVIVDASDRAAFEGITQVKDR